MKPIKNIKNRVRVKGGRASGGTRYYCAKSNGEDKMIRLMDKALNEKKQSSLVNSSVDDLVNVLIQTENILRKIRKRCFLQKK